MTITSFNDGWTVGPKTSIYAALQGAAHQAMPVRLPHDALFALARSEQDGEGPHNGYFPRAAFTYSKKFDVPDEYRAQRVTLELDGAYRDAVVFVNGVFAAQRPHGYSQIRVDLNPYLRFGTENTISVEVRTSEDSRWYTGAGLYRDARLVVTDLVHVHLDGVTITTPDVDDERAVVATNTPVVNSGLETATAVVVTEIVAADGTPLLRDSAPVTVRPGETEIVRQRQYLDSPQLWDVETPHLYSVRTSVSRDGDVVDETTATFGVRTLQLDPRRGLRVNGRSVKLRGACVHHDNGLIGAATIAAAEERRVRILKEAGFNAIRSAHNPLSPAMLEACDRLGMFVMDELTDVWTVSKSTNDYSLAFPEWWQRDVDAMVLKDRNHPSVIFYSIGNENPETGDGLAGGWGRKLAERIRDVDPTRFVTNGVNGFVAAIDVVAAAMQQQAEAAAAGGVNDAMNGGDFMNQVSASEPVTARTEEAFSILDAAGMNYGDARYALDRELFPNRVIVGTETFPSHIDVNWALVEEHPHVIGDFTWTGWDYLGEAGAGRINYLDGENTVPTFEAGFPWLAAFTGDIDITGHRRPLSYYRETVFGLRSTPYIAVVRPQVHGKPAFAGQWSWSDSVSGWSWDVADGSPTTVEVYSDAEEVELLVNGVSAGRQRVGADKARLVRFDVEFAAGEVTAVAYTGGHESGRTTLHSASGPLRLQVQPEFDAIAHDDRALAYVPITIVDENGVLAHDVDREVTVTVEGPGELLAVGSGRPDQLERFDQGAHTTWDGRALAIIRPTGPGTVTVTVAADGLDAVETAFEVGAVPDASDTTRSPASAKQAVPA